MNWFLVMTETDGSLMLTTEWVPYIIKGSHNLPHFILTPAFPSGSCHRPHLRHEKTEAGVRRSLAKITLVPGGGRNPGCWARIHCAGDPLGPPSVAVLTGQSHPLDTELLECRNLVLLL